MKRTILMGIVLIGVLGLHCLAATKSDYDHHYRLNRKPTWNFNVPENHINGATGNKDYWQPRLQTDLTQQLTAHGFTQTTTPDLLVSYCLDTTERMEVRYEHTGRPGYFTFGGLSLISWQPGWHDTTEIRTPHLKATLTLEVVDAHTHQLLWRGSDTEAVDLIKTDQSLEKAVGNLMKHFTHDIKA